MIDPIATPSFLSYWPQLLAFAGANWVVIGFVGIAVFDKQFMGAFMRCRKQVMTEIDEHYAERIKKVDGIETRVGSHEDRLEKVDAAQIQQGKELRDQMTIGFQRSERSFGEMTNTLVAIQKEAKETAVAVGRLEERVSGEWEGPNRRVRRRRTKPTDDT